VLNIYGEPGGKLTVTGGQYGAAIGGVRTGVTNSGIPGVINIYSGEIFAQGGTDSAGIGAGRNSDGNEININGGEITAISGNGGAGIGTGYATSGGASDKVGSYSAGIINITGGTVRAAAGKFKDGFGFDDFDINNTEYFFENCYEANGFGAGIGGGYGANGCTITIGGSADVTAIGSCGGAGIGAGRGTYKVSNYDETCTPYDITIEGNAKVVAASPDDTRNTLGGGAAIGGGRGFNDGGSIKILDNADVTAVASPYAAAIGGSWTVCDINIEKPTLIAKPGALEIAPTATVKAISDGFTNAIGYPVGSLIYYGTYPQSGVTDEATVAALNAKLKDSKWISYGYYSGTGTWNDGQMVPGDWMRYQDVVLDGVKYRAVTFDSYRPYVTGCTSSSNNQSSNGYSTGTTYWFKFEPIEWKVFDPDSGFIVCDSAIDSQAYNNYILSADGESWGNAGKSYRANDYANSSIRTWLNEDFKNTAFSAAQQENIKVTELDNSCPYDSNYDSGTTSDKIFLLSYSEAINSDYGFNSSASAEDTARQRTSSDYAKCQGIYKNSAGNSSWWLRSPVNNSHIACFVSDDGCADYYSIVNFTNYGVVPALKLKNLESDTEVVPIAVDIPEGITDERYIGSEITGVQAGEGYTLSGTVTATDAGSYTATAILEDGFVWSDGTYEDKEISWQINPRFIWHIDEVSLDKDSFDYDGGEKKPTIGFYKDTVLDKELVENVDYEITDITWKNNVNVNNPDETDQDKIPTAVIEVTGKGNYCQVQTHYLWFNIVKADPEVTAPEAVEGLKADGTEKELVTAGQTTGGTLEYSLNGEDYSENIPKAADEGTYTVYYRVTGNENYNDAAAQTVSAAIGENIHTITYIVDGEETAVSYNFGAPVEKPADPVKDGFNFTGWDKEIPDTMPAEDLTITAEFEAIPEPVEPTPTEPTPTEPTPTEPTPTEPTPTEPTPTEPTPTEPTPTEPTPTETEPVHEHSYKEEVTTEPTCTEDGIMTYTCECGESYTKAIPKTGHKPGEWTVVTPATTEAAGKEVRKCEVCGGTIAEREIAKLAPDTADAEIVGVNLEKINAFGIANAFGVNPEKLPAGSTVTWYVNGEKAGEGNGFQVDNPTEDYTIKAVVTNRDGKVIGETEEVTVKVNNGFFARLYYWLCRIIQKAIDAFKNIGK
jgi:cell division septation protein DedD